MEQLINSMEENSGVADSVISPAWAYFSICNGPEMIYGWQPFPIEVYVRTALKKTVKQKTS